jgi:DNA polymerase-1
MVPEDFTRLIGYNWRNKEEVRITTSLDELIEEMDKARWIVGHNIHAFDFKAVYGPWNDKWLELTEEGRVLNTWTHAVLVNPAPHSYINRHGKKALADSPDKMKAWFGLDEQAHQLGVPGKSMELSVLAKEFGDPELKPAARIVDGYGKIPQDDPRYREYLKHDVLASKHVADALIELGPINDYALREQRIEARKEVIASNGVRVDQELAKARVEELSVKREQIMLRLVEEYDFPTEGKQPWRSNEGKAAIVEALKDVGINPEKQKDWPRTDTGNISLGGKVLLEQTKGTPAEDFGSALAELMGQRSLAQLALDSVHADGFAHPDITMLQRSGRWSTTKPGLTVWTANGPGAVEKSYFIPDNPDEVMFGIDLSNADARVVAAYSGDTKYAERFEPGADGHMINALAAWGKALVESDPKKFRQLAKPLGHGWSYGGQANTLSKQTGTPLKDARQFCDGMAKAFKVLVGWQNKIRAYAHAHGYVVNDWGRKMPVEKGREFTQAPALIGQSGTREIMCDILLDMPMWLLKCVKMQVHDEFIFSVPARHFDKYRDFAVKLMTRSFKPKHGGQRIEFPATGGPAGRNWYEAGH